MGWLLGAMLVGGMLGGMARVSGYQQDYMKYMEDSEAEIKNLERKREQELKTAQIEYDTEKEKANKEADKSDKQSTLNEGYTAEGFNAGLDQLKAGQEAEAVAFNEQAVANGKSTGDALSSMAASGTRSSSMEQAIDLEAAMNAMQLQATEDQARASDNIQLANLFTSLNQSVNSIQTARTDALDLRKSYLEGGSAFNLYQNKITNLKDNYDASITEVERQRKYAKNNWRTGVLTSFFGGFGSGASFGASTATSIKNWTV